MYLLNKQFPGAFIMEEKEKKHALFLVLILNHQ